MVCVNPMGTKAHVDPISTMMTRHNKGYFSRHMARVDPIGTMPGRTGTMTHVNPIWAMARVNPICTMARV